MEGVRKTLSIILLNEVLSLNAQESHRVAVRGVVSYLLNEVLSLNAQDFGFGFELWEFVVSSMKS